jgi:hypothetical protein
MFTLLYSTPSSPSFQQPQGRFIIIVIYYVTSEVIIHLLLSNFLGTHCWILLKHTYLSKYIQLVCNWIHRTPGSHSFQNRSSLKLNTIQRKCSRHKVISEKLGWVFNSLWTSPILSVLLLKILFLVLNYLSLKSFSTFCAGRNSWKMLTQKNLNVVRKMEDFCLETEDHQSTWHQKEDRMMSQIRGGGWRETGGT